MYNLEAKNNKRNSKAPLPSSLLAGWGVKKVCVQLNSISWGSEELRVAFNPTLGPCSSLYRLHTQWSRPTLTCPHVWRDFLSQSENRKWSATTRAANFYDTVVRRRILMRCHGVGAICSMGCWGNHGARCGSRHCSRRCSRVHSSCTSQLHHKTRSARQWNVTRQGARNLPRNHWPTSIW